VNANAHVDARRRRRQAIQCGPGACSQRPPCLARVVPGGADQRVQGETYWVFQPAAATTADGLHETHLAATTTSTTTSASTTTTTIDVAIAIATTTTTITTTTTATATATATTAATIIAAAYPVAAATSAAATATVTPAAVAAAAAAAAVAVRGHLERERHELPRHGGAVDGLQTVDPCTHHGAVKRRARLALLAANERHVRAQRGVPLYHLEDFGEFLRGRFERLALGGDVVEEILHGDGGAGHARARFRAAILQLPVAVRCLERVRGVRRHSGHREVRNETDACQRLAAETKGSDGVQVLEGLQFAGGVALAQDGQVGLAPGAHTRSC